jgi:hypothetical protein
MTSFTVTLKITVEDGEYGAAHATVNMQLLGEKFLLKRVVMSETS